MCACITQGRLTGALLASASRSTLQEHKLEQQPSLCPGSSPIHEAETCNQKRPHERGLPVMKACMMNGLTGSRWLRVVHGIWAALLSHRLFIAHDHAALLWSLQQAHACTKATGLKYNQIDWAANACGSTRSLKYMDTINDQKKTGSLALRYLPVGVA